ncbi:MAG: tetratricopeptide repeat-containing sulfotransferase family protein [Pseudomonadota bacterium]
MHKPAQSTKNQASSLYQAGRLPEAGAAYAQLCTQFPRDPEAWNMLGVIRGRLGAAQEAERYLRRALELDPQYGPAWSNLGTLMQHAGRLDDAAACFRRSLSINPADAVACNNLGTVLREQGKVAEAMDCYRAAVRMKPRHAQAHNNLGTLLHEQCNAQDAIESYRKALKAEPRFAQAHYNLGVSLQSVGAHDQALYHYEKALQLEPGMTDAVAAIARMHEKEGRFDDARKRLEPYLDGHPPPPIALAYAILSRHTQDQRRAATLLEEAVAQARPSPVQRQEMEFALGDLYDDLGDYDRAFHHYRTANGLRPGRFDAEAYRAQIEAITREVDRRLLTRLGSAADTDERPIFILGMPRSGTSLIEQILASHPDVHGAGELPHLGTLVNELQKQAQAPYPRFLAGMSPEGVRNVGRKYLKLLDGISKTARFVTDKMPHNFLFLGLIGAALPGAKIIHCIRNPMDTCLSIYFHNFNSNHPYSNDLEDLGRYYRGYTALMDHWREVLGAKLFEVTYEDLIANQAQNTRELLAHCGLEWSDACLNFHENKRIVNTPSYGQVRKPIYRSSVERWRNYESHLAPLRNALGFA